MSFNISISGLNATNQQLNTISNNIANVSSYGFKGSRTEFSAIYNGGQAGGVEVASISQNFDTNGGLVGTGRALDLAITGGGFFTTVDSKGQNVYTRSGAFSMDKDSYIVSNTGNRLQGYGVDSNGNLQSGQVTDLTIGNDSLAAKASNKIDFSANFDSRASVVEDIEFDADDATSFTSSYTTEVYDSLGNAHTVSQYFIKTGENSWEVQVMVNGENVTPDEVPQINFTEEGALDESTSTVPFSIEAYPLGAATLNINIDLSGTTQYAAEFGVSKNNPNGYAAGELTGIRIEDNGMVFAQYSNGQNQLQGQVVLADFPNPNGLVQGSGSSWTQSFASGTPVIGAPDSGIFGSLTAGALEGSNVDLTNELVNLMTAQRNYQANTKTISASDQLTQALFNAV